jgi:hypothetical protein
MTSPHPLITAPIRCDDMQKESATSSVSVTYIFNMGRRVPCDNAAMAVNFSLLFELLREHVGSSQLSPSLHHA